MPLTRATPPTHARTQTPVTQPILQTRAAPRAAKQALTQAEAAMHRLMPGTAHEQRTTETLSARHRDFHRGCASGDLTILREERDLLRRDRGSRVRRKDGQISPILFRRGA